MYSDPMLEAPLEATDAMSPLPPRTKEITMKRHYERPKCLLLRAVVFAAALAASATLLIAVGGAFYSVSSEPVLADSPRAQFAVAGCDGLGDRFARQRCARRLVAEAKARDAGAAQFAAFSASQRRAGQ